MPLKKPPRYIINPMAAREPLWLPHVWQMAVADARNPSYLNSLWLGTVYNLMLVPQRLFSETLVSLFNFQLGKCLFSLFAIPVSVLLFLIMGLSGRLAGINVTLEQAANALILKPAEGLAALEEGFTDLVIDLDKHQSV